MGGGMSIEQSNKQTALTKIAQQSTESCMVACSAVQNINIVAKGGSMTDVNFKDGCISNVSSCALKASLQSSIFNNLKSQQGATQFDVPGIFTFLEDLIGAGDNINQQNSQLISNQASQFMNSVCQNNISTPQNIDLTLTNVNLKDVTFGNYATSNKFSCIINNMGSFYAQNDESNTQQATQIRIDSMVFLALIIVAGVVAVAALKYGFQKKSVNTSGSNSLEKLEVKSIFSQKSSIKKPPKISNPMFTKKLLKV